MQSSTKIVLLKALDANYFYYQNVDSVGVEKDMNVWDITREKLLEILTEIFKDRTLRYSESGILSKKDGTLKLLFAYDGRNVMQEGKVILKAY